MPRKTKEINEEKIAEKEVEAVLSKKEAKATAKKATKTTSSKVKTTGTSSKTTKTKKTTKSAEAKKTVQKIKTKTTSTQKRATKKDVKTITTSMPMAVEYYDLPYKYNTTIVKVLYQNPTTLFVYWEISDEDIENYKKIYGENFFETTDPILTIYNDTMNYTFEIPINDYANSWYFKINDAKCNYHVELGRRPKNHYTVQENYVYITSSNIIETPNNKILFSTNKNNSIYFKNTKNNSYRKIELPQIISNLNLTNKEFDFPLIRNVQDLYTRIFQVEDIESFNTVSNPSSGNPSSSSGLSSRFN